jgi:hypothetical protein
LPYRASKAFAGALGVAAVVVTATPALSHVIVGPRFFPATLTIEDPGVNDEASLPSFTSLTGPDGVLHYDYSFEWQKRITPELSVSVGSTLARLSDPANKFRATGWQNLESAFTLQVLTVPEHEFVISMGVAAEWGRTGNPTIGAESFSVVTPRLFFGKGFGDLPTSLDPLRPFAITGQLGISIPTRPLIVRPGDIDVNEDTGLSTFGPPDIEKVQTLFNYGFSLQYSLPYMNSNVLEVGGPEFLKHLIPLVEVSFATPISNIPTGGTKTIGIVAPGVIYATRYFQIGAEALIPINGASGKHVGVVAQLNLYLDDIFPDSIGRPIFAPAGFASSRTPF